MEGPDGTGKSTLADKLARHYGCDIMHLIERGSKHFRDYNDKSFLYNIVSDRCFLSEPVYAEVFNRKTQLTEAQTDRLMRYYRMRKWKFLILDSKTDELVKRLKVRGDEEEEIIQNVDKLRKKYKVIARKYNIPIVDTSKCSFEDILKILEESE